MAAVSPAPDFNGNGFIQGFNFGASGFDFVENGVYTIDGASGITIGYRVTGSQLATGISFNSGVSEITANNTGLALTGLIEILAPGYFFTADGTDLHGDALEFSIAIQNAIAQPNAELVDDLVCNRGAFDGPGCNGEEYANNLPFYWLVADRGSLKLTAKVPEPGSLALVTTALAASSLLRRRPAA